MGQRVHRKINYLSSKGCGNYEKKFSSKTSRIFL